MLVDLDIAIKCDKIAAQDRADFKIVSLVFGWPVLTHTHLSKIGHPHVPISYGFEDL